MRFAGTALPSWSKAISCTAPARRAAGEPIEDVGQELGGDPAARVANHDLEVPVADVRDVTDPLEPQNA